MWSGSSCFPHVVCWFPRAFFCLCAYLFYSGATDVYLLVPSGQGYVSPFSSFCLSTAHFCSCEAPSLSGTSSGVFCCGFFHRLTLPLYHSLSRAILVSTSLPLSPPAPGSVSLHGVPVFLFPVFSTVRERQVYFLFLLVLHLRFATTPVLLFPQLSLVRSAGFRVNYTLSTHFSLLPPFALIRVSFSCASLCAPIRHIGCCSVFLSLSFHPLA